MNPRSAPNNVILQDLTLNMRKTAQAGDFNVGHQIYGAIYFSRNINISSKIYIFAVESQALTDNLENCMERRHENSLKDLLETVAFEGHASVKKWKLSWWYGQQNFTVTIRRNIRERWISLLKDELGWKPSRLRIADAMDTIIFIKESDFFPDKE